MKKIPQPQTLVSKPLREFKPLLQTQNKALLDCYENESEPLSEADQNLLYPILNSLEDHEERYEEVGPIAEGGEKKITRVHDKRLNRYVAMARSVRTNTKEEQEQFLREARLEANLGHPNIMPVFNMGLDSEETPFFTMELIPGDSLQTILKKIRAGDESYKRNFSLQNLLHIYLKVCDAIAYAHSRNVLHLDIKPANIRVGQFGEVFVCDWGLAKVTFNEESPIAPDTIGELDGDVLNEISLTGIIKGSPGFMAPEQTAAGGGKTFQTDIYALGALLYNLLTHKLPVQGNSNSELIKNTTEGRIVPPRRNSPDLRIPTGLAAVAMKALSLKPENRYDSVMELRHEIHQYLAGYPTDAGNANFITTFSLLMQRHSRITFLLIFFLLLLAVIMSVNLAVIRNGKLKAETNFALYRQEQQAVILLNKDLRNAIVSTVKSTSFMNLNLTLRVMESADTSGFSLKENQDLLAKKGAIHFMLHQFTTANRNFEEAGEKSTFFIRNIIPLSKKYAAIKPDGTHLLTHRQMADLIRDSKATNQRTSLILYHMYQNYIRNNPAQSPEEALPLAEAMLNKLNHVRGRTPPLKLSRTDKGYHLDLDGTPYKEYILKTDAAHNENVLRPLNLYSLNISHTSLSSETELAGIQLKELQMVGVNIPVGNLASRLQRLGVEKLVIDTDAYAPFVIKKLRTKCEVVNKPNVEKPD